ncbi:putative bifunctional diguanylate cyclase/phosphodiesterase [Magnetococcus sp. PR-3]|uniref:putative bifunctional diguanylate cyclase/phosphodiesterase n=1 Tax=Magnetococcus sp. PR-3 TaxID=3120355 RepID=UPI002FCE5590
MPLWPLGRWFSLRILSLLVPALLLVIFWTTWRELQPLRQQQSLLNQQIISNILPLHKLLYLHTETLRSLQDRTAYFLKNSSPLSTKEVYLRGREILDSQDESNHHFQQQLTQLIQPLNLHNTTLDLQLAALNHQLRRYRDALVSALKSASLDPKQAPKRVQLIATRHNSISFAAADLFNTLSSAASQRTTAQAQKLDQQFHTLAWTGSSILLITLFISLVMLTRVRGNITILAHALKGLSEGDYQWSQNCQKKLDTDFAILKDVTNHLSDLYAKLRQSNDALLQERLNLEQRVAKRTQALQQFNDHLLNEIEQRRAAEEQLHLYQRVVEHTDEAVLITDKESRVIAVNEAYLRITGYVREDVLGYNPRISQSGHHDARFYQQMWQSIATHGVWRGEIWDKRKDGSIFPKWLTINTVYDHQGEVINYVGIFIDITEQKATEKKLEDLAFKDSLTGLPNRTLYQDRLQRELEVATRQDWGLMLFFIDLDRFKMINDTLGHDMGDLLLKAVATRIQKTLRKSDIVCRLGGDEFTVILPELSSQRKATELAKAILTQLHLKFQLHEHEAHIGASIGIACFPQDGRTAPLLNKHADVAMYQAKKAGRGTYRFFQEEMNQVNTRRAETESHMRIALEEAQFKVWFQPKVDLHSQRIVGAEALARWHHPDKGVIHPDQFIAIAEQTNLILPLGQQILRQACRSAKLWIQQHGQNLPVAVNISPRQFRDTKLLQRVTETLQETGLPAECLELEITESMAMADMNHALNVVTSLKKIGVRIAIDDFGTGYSSLNYLHQFPIEILKIDRTFIQKIDPENPRGQAVVDAILLMAQQLGLEVVAEGVENTQQLEHLKRKNCQHLQGYLFCPPVEATEFQEILTASNQGKAWAQNIKKEA